MSPSPTPSSGSSSPDMQSGDHSDLTQDNSDSRIVGMAIVVLPPSSLESVKAIENFRSKYEKTYASWPPHVTLLPSNHLPIAHITPEEAHDVLSNALSTKDYQPFTVTLDRVSVLWHKTGAATIILEPSESTESGRLAARQLRSIYKTLLNGLPSNVQKVIEMQNDHRAKGGVASGFRPHLT
ncbi:hypothetical protein HDU76_002961, partial [Blyttiomyces sp. JEL0837]